MHVRNYVAAKHITASTPQFSIMHLFMQNQYFLDNRYSSGAQQKRWMTGKAANSAKKRQKP